MEELSKKQDELLQNIISYKERKNNLDRALRINQPAITNFEEIRTRIINRLHNIDSFLDS